MPALPRWFVLLPLLAIAAWWPLDPYWQSDDFLALNYSRDLGAVLHDFVGPQYGATDVWLFYRPLITLSFWFDQLVAGADPFFSHLSNVLAHGLSALLVGLLWRRFLPDRAAFCAGLCWAMMPGHVGSLAWAVGRVDSHTTVWILLATWLFVRRLDRVADGDPTARWPILAATTLAFMSKESAFVLPPILTVLAATRTGGDAGRRLRRAGRESGPIWLLFAAYLAFRWLVLGRFGGYLAASYDPRAMAIGLLTYIRNVTVPICWSGQDHAALTMFGLSPAVLIAIAVAPLLWPVLWWLRRPLRLGLALLLFVVAMAPLAAFLGAGDLPHNLRYLYLPSVVLAGLLAAPGRLATGLVLIVWAIPFVAMRTDQRAADRQSAALHAAIRRQVDDGVASPMFVAGLPHANAKGTVVQLHWAIDRLLAPPFGDGGTGLYALRPLVEVPGVFRLSPQGDLPSTLPFGSTWFFADETAFGRAPAGEQLPDLPVRGDVDGVVDLSSRRLLIIIID
ncbi:MAG: hypothetical protein KDC98_25215 [Planctomycetes bacterium]|nr:hypothetical protein [Planctomycetota bacterium]